jgi:D-aminoacyl-tRNA deacylase
MQKLFPNQMNQYRRVSLVILLVSSSNDVASLNIRKQILSHYPFKENAKSYQQNPLFSVNLNGAKVVLATLKEESVNAQNLPIDFPDIDLLIFISRHSSRSGKPTLSVHAPGNFGKAEFGGLPNQVSIAPALAMQDALKALFWQKKVSSLNYEVSYECTHHGPSLKIPTVFVELGSSQIQWEDTKAATAVAHATMTMIANFSDSTSTIVALGIGGTHYNQKFTNMALGGEVVFGHIIPKYAVNLINREMLQQCVERTMGKVLSVILDWKGIRSEDKPAILSTIKRVGLSSRKV